MGAFQVVSGLGRFFRPGPLLVWGVLTAAAFVSAVLQGYPNSAAAMLAIATLASIVLFLVLGAVAMRLLRRTAQGVHLWPGALAIAILAAAGIALSLAAISIRNPTSIDSTAIWSVLLLGPPIWFLFFWAFFVAARRILGTRV